MKYIVIFLLLPVLLFAQSSSENFILTKSVIDAGGGVSSSENFNQLSAFGQPSPLGQQSSENFMLSPGFLSPRFLVSPLSPIQELVIKENQPDVNLWWEAIPGAGTYSVHRGTVSTFTPDGSNLLGTTASTSYTDTGITATTAERYFYIVTSSP
jgi:hypothetical protein